MARRRPTPAKSLKKQNTPLRDRLKASRFHTESLEPRRMFVVLHGGDVFEFWAENTHIERIVVTGNTTAEFFGTDPLLTDGLAPGGSVTLDSMHGVIVSGPDFIPQGGIETGTQIGGGLAPEAAPNAGAGAGGGGGGGSGTSTAHNASIWAIYVSQSDVTSSIAIAATNPIGSATRNMLPFTGSETLHVRPTSGAADIDVSVANSGDVYIGARAFPAQSTGGSGGGGGTPANFPTNQPILGAAALPLDEQTVSPGITALGPGLTVAPGNNMGQFLLGGTLSGTVNIHGAINLFYAGWLVTGNTLGTGGAAAISVPQNFNVDGDIHTLLTNGSIGTNTDAGGATPTYTTGFSMHVGGKAGMVKSLDSFVGSLDVTNSPTAPSLDGTPYDQIDRRSGDSWDQGVFGGDGAVNDQNFLGAQFLNAIDNTGTIQVNGTTDAVNGKTVDYYAVPLLAGQTVTPQVTAQLGSGLTGFTGLTLAVFDPLERLMASDLDEAGLSLTSGAPFRFTAQIPGIYYFAVANTGNNTFAAGAGGGGAEPYTLTINNVGTMGLGALAATTNVFSAGLPLDPFSSNSASVHVVNGDLGAVFAGNDVIAGAGGGAGVGVGGGGVGGVGGGGTIAGTESYFLDNGNLRAVTGASLGVLGASFANAPSAGVPNGSVGMLRATGAGIGWNLNGTLTIGLNGTILSGESAIGGDYQMIDSAGQFAGDLIAQGNIGSIRAAAMTLASPSLFQVNALDDSTKHGTIDLIDVAGDFGTLGTGGPAIMTGPGGNCRYIHVGGNTFRDPFFGGGGPDTTLYQPGETAVITDDSGANVTIAPTNVADSLIIGTYPIESSGGSAIISIRVTNTTNATTAGGVNITTSGSGTAEIGSIILDGNGTAVTAGTVVPVAAGTTTIPTTFANFPPPGGPGGAPISGAAAAGTKFTLPVLPTVPTLAVGGLPIDVSLSGSKTDVYSVINGTGTGQVTSLTNSSQGEVVNLQLPSAGTVSVRGALGIALEHNTASTVIGNYITGTGMEFSYPLYEVTSLARITGNVISISAGTLGNLLVGTISGEGAPALGSLPPAVPASATNGTGTNGQVGSIRAGAIVGSVVTAGIINSISASSIAWHGSGLTNVAGVFSTGLIGPMTVSGDVRGQIISTVGQLGLTITNGSLIDATVANYTRFDFAESRAGVVSVPGSTAPFTRPELDLGGVVVKGNGGIIGSLIGGSHVGVVSTATTGFGILSSTIDAAIGSGTIVGVAGGGYGIRSSFLSGGASFGAITALGDGSQVPVTNFARSLRNSETGATFDPVTGMALSFLNDLDLYLGTSASAPRIVGVTESGVIENVLIQGSRDVGSINAWSIRTRAATDTNSQLLFAEGNAVNVANTVAQINVKGPIDGFTVTTGRTSKYNFGGSVQNFVLTVAGPIGSLVFNSSLLGTSSINAVGPGGRIASLVVHGNFSGFIRATKSIGTIQINGSLSGIIQAQSLGTVKLTGGLGQGSLQITGSVGTIQTTGDLGVPGNNLTIFGSLKVLKVGRDLNTGLSVGKNLGQLLVGGNVLNSANINVGNTITLLRVDGDVEAGGIIKARIIKKRLIHGQLLGTITTA